MKKILMFTCMFAVLSGCSIRKQFSVVVDPPDAEIRVIPGSGRSERTYTSPADITVYIPKDAAEAAESRVEIRRDTYKTKTISLGTIEEKKHKIKLDKQVLYQPKYRMVLPAVSDELSYRDRIIAVTIVPGEHRFELKIENLTQKPLNILWDRAEYIDYMNRHHPLMHSGIRPQDRNDIVRPQLIPAGGSLREAFFPKSSVSYSGVLKEYVMKQLLPLDTESALSLKGRTLNVFLPVEMDRAIIPDYNFKFQIVDMVKE